MCLGFRKKWYSSPLYTKMKMCLIVVMHSKKKKFSTSFIFSGSTIGVSFGPYNLYDQDPYLVNEYVYGWASLSTNYFILVNLLLKWIIKYHMIWYKFHFRIDWYINFQSFYHSRMSVCYIFRNDVSKERLTNMTWPARAFC